MNRQLEPHPFGPIEFRRDMAGLRADQKMITGTPRAVLDQIANGRRAGLFRLDGEVSAVGNFAWASVTMLRPMPAGTRPLVIAGWITALVAVPGILVGLYTLMSAAGGLVLAGTVAGLVVLVAVLRQRSPEPAVTNVRVDVEVRR